ncbi:MAG: hypothetical protein ACLSS9_03805 [Acutalibacteraceae bacterium]
MTSPPVRGDFFVSPAKSGDCVFTASQQNYCDQILHRYGGGYWKTDFSLEFCTNHHILSALTGRKDKRMGLSTGVRIAAAGAEKFILTAARIMLRG